MVKYRQRIAINCLTTIFLCNLFSVSLAAIVSRVSLLNSDAAIAQTSARRSPTNRDIEKLRRSGQRWIEVRLRSQKILAWQGNQLVYAVLVSTGKSNTPTPTGIFKIQTKYPVARMRGDDYNIPDVPHVMYYSGNYAIHGAYWHRSFGIPVSRGCTNVAPDHAAWLYQWAGVGTTVVVR